MPESSAPPDGRVREQVLQLVAGLSASGVQEVLDLLATTEGDMSAKAVAVRLALIERLNRFRPHRARRLFTELFEPLLITDAALLRANRPVPGAIQRLDLAALWQVLSTFGIPELIVEVQSALDAMAASQRLEDAMATPAAAALQDRMRMAAIRYLARTLGAPDRLGKVLTQINRHRLAETRKAGSAAGEVAGLDETFLTTLVDLLRDRGVVAPILRHCLDRAAATPANARAAVRATEHLAGRAEELQGLIPDPARARRVAGLVPLAILNVRQRYDLIVHWLRDRQADEPEAALVIEALFGHLSGCCQAMLDRLQAALRTGDGLSAEPIRLDVGEIAEIDLLFERFAQVVRAILTADLLATPAADARFRLIWTDLSRFLWTRAVPVAERRLTEALATRLHPSEDHDATLWLLRRLIGWQRFAADHGLATGPFPTWRDGLADDIRLAAGQALRITDGDRPEERMAHLMRIDAAARLLGLRLAEFLPLSSRNLPMILDHHLQRPDPIEPNEAALITDLLDLIRTELVRSRNWQDPGLIDLVRLASNRGLRARPPADTASPPSPVAPGAPIR